MANPTGRYFTVIGNLTKDPEAKKVDNRTVVEFTVARNPERYNPESKKHERTGPTEFYDVSVWGAQGEHALNSLHKGDRAMVGGVLTETQFDRGDGEKGINRNLTAREVAVSLQFAEVAVVQVRDTGVSL